MNELITDVATRRLKEEIKAGLVEAMNSSPQDKDGIREVLADRRTERLRERYSELDTIEREFMDVVNVPIDWENIDPAFRWVETSQERRIWDYTRNIVSSMPENAVIGRQMRFYLQDDNSKRWLGIVCLVSALGYSSPRHKRLQWDSETKWTHMNQILNIAVCVPIQPFGLLLGGKLLFVASLSNEVRERYERLYGDQLLAIETTSLYGKSSQYNRVKEFDYLGLTKGQGNVHVSAELYQKMMELLALHPSLDPIEGTTYEIPTNVKMRRVSKIARVVGLKEEGSAHGQRRGYYWGVTAENSEAILRGNDEPPRFYDRPLETLTSFWRERWYEMRLPKKQAEIEAFDPDIYLLDNNVAVEDQGARQAWLF